MKRKFYLILIINLFLAGIMSIKAQSTEGTVFWLTFGANFPTHNDYSGVDLQIRIVSNERPTKGSIFFTKFGFSLPFNIGAKQVYTYSLDDAEKQAVYNTTMGVSNFSIRITTDNPVSVYALNQAPYSTDATNVLPVTALGTEYYHISYSFRSNLLLDAYAVVAIENNTNLYHNGILETILDAGQVYYKTDTIDMTGAHITTNHPVAFFAVNQGVYIPLEYPAGDCLFQQLPPVNTWGMNFFVPVSHRTRDIVRIVASQDNTDIIQIGGILLFPEGGQTRLDSLQAGQFVELEVSLENNGCYIQTNKPVGVCSFLTGNTYNEPLLGISDSDPAQSWLAPIEQTVTEALITPFVPVGNTALKGHYALIITPTATKNDTRVSIGWESFSPLFGGNWRDNSASGLSFYGMPLTDFTTPYHYINSKGLIVMCYGTGQNESYYYLAYSAMNNLKPGFYANTVHNLDLPSEIFCTNNITFQARITGISPNPDNLKWYIDGVEEISARDQLIWDKYFPVGEYEIKMWVRFYDDDTTSIVSTLNIGVLVDVSASPPEGGTVVGDGCFKRGSTTNLIATPNECYKFVNWTENGVVVSTDTLFTVIVTEPRTFVANFKKPSYNVKVESNNSDYGYATGTGEFENCSEVQATAVVNDCYRFANWTIDGVVVSEENPYTFTVSDSVHLVANFYALDFDTYCPILWNNTLMLDLRKLEGEGYNAKGCKWYKNGTEVYHNAINEFSYSAGENATDLLELAPTWYMFRLITDSHGELCSTIKTLTSYDFFSSGKLVISPNPVISGVPFKVENVVEGEPVKVYNQWGSCVESSIAAGNSISIELHVPAGIYLIVANKKYGKVLIVK